MNQVLCRQMAADYCCTPEDVMDRNNHFTEHRFLDGRRRYEEKAECFLRIAVINGKVLFTGNRSIIRWCEDNFADADGAWFFEAEYLRKLNDRLHEDGHRIEKVHPFYISEKVLDVDPGSLDIHRYERGELEQFRGDKRFYKALTFEEAAPDMLAVTAEQNGKILGMAGASCDSPTMWQIGINIEPEARKAGIAKILVTLLKNEILKRGILPYYGTAVSHIASQKVAAGAGFVPAWAELVTV